MSLKKALVAVLLLAGSAVALAAALYFEAGPALAAAPTARPLDPALAPFTSKLAIGSTTPRTGSRAAAAAASTAEAPPPPTLSVPDFKGKRLSAARRQARSLGIAILARDDEGQTVSAELASAYRVRRQLTQAGAAVEPGATVEVRVREAETPQGY